MYLLYRTVTQLIAPFVPLVLKRRVASGKEDTARLQERLGAASLTRPPGKLVWIHAASVGEANSVLLLVEGLIKSYPALHILMTTVTVTSARLMSARLPDRAFHQFAPVDMPDAVCRFLAHWRPDIALFVDSELWPNMIMEAKKHGTLMGIINARMSENSFGSWQLARPLIRGMLSGFKICFAQSREDGRRLMELGIPAVTGIGNLKYDAPKLSYGEAELMVLQAAVAGRTVWVAASTHPGEDTIIADVHKALKSEGNSLVTIIVPRHAVRGDEIAHGLRHLSVAQRSKGESIMPETDIYVADTMGELGLFYSLAQIVFIGGTLVPHGGQNPLEAARFGCAIITAEHVQNFRDIISAMVSDEAIMQVTGREGLADALRQLIQDVELRRRLGTAAERHVQSREGMVNKIMKELQPHLT